MKALPAMTLFLFLPSLASHAAGPANEYVKFIYQNITSEIRTGIIAINPELSFSKEDGTLGVFQATSKQAYDAVDKAIHLNPTIHVYGSAIVYPSGVKDGEYREVSLQLGKREKINSKEITIKEVIAVYIENNDSLLTKLNTNDANWAKVENMHEIDRIELDDNSGNGGVCITTFYSHAPGETGGAQAQKIKSIILKNANKIAKTQPIKDKKNSELIDLISALKEHKIVLTSRCEC